VDSKSPHLVHIKNTAKKINRITAMLSGVFANGRKLPPHVTHKGKIPLADVKKKETWHK